jgi:hypothetical protein
MNIIPTYKATPPPKDRPTWIHFCILLWSAFWRLEPKNRANVGVVALVIVLPIGLGFMALMDKIVQATHADESFKHDRITMLAPASITLSVEDAGKPSFWQPIAEPAKAKRPPQKRDTAPRSVKELAPADAFEYIERWKDAAIKSARKTGVPASITLAQGIVESNSGRSYLAVNANNHFGIKCQERKCYKGHCVNRMDDTHKDFFRKFKNAKACFDFHGELLSKGRYKPLHKYGRKDYEAWAYGLKRVGYATDPNYARTLIGTIKKFGLNKYD